MKKIIIGISCFSFIVNLHSMDNADKSGVSSGESPIINKVYDVNSDIGSDELSDTNSDIDLDESSDTNSDIGSDELSDTNSDIDLDESSDTNSDIDLDEFGDDDEYVRDLARLRETFDLIDKLPLSEDVCSEFRKAYREYLTLLRTRIESVYNSADFFQNFKDAIIGKNKRHLLLSDEVLFSMGYSAEAYSIDDLMSGGLLPKNSIQVWQLISKKDSIKSKKIFHILEAGSLSYEPGLMIKNADFIGDETNELGSFLEIISRDYLLFLFNIFETSPDDFLKTAIALIKENEAFTESATDGKKASVNKEEDEYFDFSDACSFLDRLMIICEKFFSEDFREEDMKSYVQCLVFKTFMLYVAKNPIVSNFEPCTIFSDLDKFDFSWKDFDSQKDEIFDFILKKSSDYLLKQNNNVERRDANAVFINSLIQKKIDSFRDNFVLTPSMALKFSRKDQNYYDVFMTLVKKYNLLSKDSENSASRFKDKSLGIFKDEGLDYKIFDTLFSNILANAKARVVDKASLIEFLRDTEELLKKWGLPSDDFLDYLVQIWGQESSSDTQANISNKLFGENSPIVKNDGLSFFKNRPGIDSDSDDDGFKTEMESAYSDFCRSVLLLAEGVLKNIEDDFALRTGIFYDRRIAYYTIYHLGKNFDSFFSIIKEQNGICQSQDETIFSNNIKLMQNIFVNDVGLRIDGLNTLFFAVLDASDFKELPYPPSACCVTMLNLGIGQLALFRSLFHSCDENGEENPQDMSIAACMELVSHSPFRMIKSVVEVSGTLPSVRLDYIANALKIHMPSFWGKISNYNLSFSKYEIFHSILGISESHVRGSAPADAFLKKWCFNVNQIKTDKVDISVADLTTLSPYFCTQFRIRWVAKILEILLIEGEEDLVDISIRQFPDLMDLMGQMFYKNEAWRGNNAQDYLEIFRKTGFLKQRKKLRIAKN